MAGVWTRLIVGAACFSAMVASNTFAQSMKPEVFERVRKATVMVKTAFSKDTEGDSPLSSGTGFFVNSTGLCISNDHVTDPGHGKSPREKAAIWQEFNRLSWTVITESGTNDEHEYKANVLYSNDQADMAVMQVYDDDGEFLDTPSYLDFYPTDAVEKKTKLWNLGFPGGDTRKKSRGKNPEIAVQAGNVIALPMSPSGRIKGVVTNILANQGNSGGPAVDIDGRLVGIATLAGGGDTGRSAITILIPADLTRQMIKIAFEEGRVPSGVDLAPFHDLFVGSDRVWRLPLRERFADRDCITMEGGSLLCGSLSEPEMTWPTPLGDLKIPNSAMAYVVTSGSDATAFLEGGDRFAVERDDLEIQFTPAGAGPIDVDPDGILCVAYRLPAVAPRVSDKPAFVIGGKQVNISFSEISGQVKFDAEPGGTMTIPVGEVLRIETDEVGTILHTTGGSRLAGSFLPHELTGRLAWSGTHVTFSFENIEQAVMKTVDYAAMMHSVELPLAESLSTTDRRFVKLAVKLDAGDLASASSALDRILDADTFRVLSPQKKEEAKRMQGELALRSGNYAEAGAIFKRLKRAETDDVRWHAQARLAMLERFPDGKFNDGDISDPLVFEQGAVVLAKERIREGKRVLEDLEAGALGEPPARREYLRFLRQTSSAEESLLIANRLRGGTTEELLVRLWRNLTYLHANEIVRLQKEFNEFRDSQNSNPAGRTRNISQRQREKKVARFESDIERATEAFGEMRMKLQNAGFIIDDSDRDIADDG